MVPEGDMQASKGGKRPTGLPQYDAMSHNDHQHGAVDSGCSRHRHSLAVKGNHAWYWNPSQWATEGINIEGESATTILLSQHNPYLLLNMCPYAYR